MTVINPQKVEELEGTLPELEDAMTYTLADAIREGSTVTDQAIGTWTNDDGTEACALSAALLAAKARHML